MSQNEEEHYNELLVNIDELLRRVAKEIEKFSVVANQEYSRRYKRNLVELKDRIEELLV